MTPAELALAVFGLLAAFAVGSFICVIIERLPVELAEPDEYGDWYEMRPWAEVLGGTSHCSACGAGIRWYDKVPLVSWLVLRGRCRSCGDRIPGFHPAVEAAVPALGVALIAAYGWEARLVPALWLIPVGITVAAIDLRTFMAPTKIIWPAFGASVAASVIIALTVGEPRWLLGGVIGVATMAGPLALLWFLMQSGMGFGDVRLATLVGWTVGFTTIRSGWASAVLMGLLSMVLAAVGGIVLGVAVLGVRGRKARVPFGPTLILGGLACIAVSSWVLDAYGMT